MQPTWIGGALVAGVLGVVGLGGSAPATPDLIKKDTSKCGSLKNSVYTFGLCRDDRTGEASAISVQCCCCTEGANQPSFIGG